MSLADELLADLEEAGEADDEHLLLLDAPVQEVADIPMEIDTKFQSVRAIAKLRDSDQLKRVMEEIAQRKNSERKEAIGPVEADPEYLLIVEANNLAVEIDNEIRSSLDAESLHIFSLCEKISIDSRIMMADIIHKFIRDKYSKRFPELESLVPVPLQYVSTVKELGNDLDKAKNSEILQEFLTPATIMVVSVTASTTQGQLLTDEDLKIIFEACDMAIELDNFKQEIYAYVESRMSFIAPNISVIVGASTAAKLMGVAGGLSNLAKMPACNIMVLGSQRKTLAGFSTTAIMPHTGFVYSCDIVQNTPADLRRKAARLVASKCAIAARVDGFHESVDGSVGHSLREDIERKLDKLQEPPPVKQVKPLPAPIDQPHKKRGGRRVRKMKERYAITEFRKQANRMNFGEIEEDAYQDDLGFSLGQVGKAGTGRIRAPQIDEKTKVRISKTLQKNLQRQQVWGGSTSVRRQISGTASSVAFTPLQGLEIVNPQAAEKKVNESSVKYFSNTSGFIKVEKKV